MGGVSPFTLKGGGWVKIKPLFQIVLNNVAECISNKKMKRDW
jgi:hypothetical protein